MKNLGLNEIRELFKEFYVSKGHYPQKSASLIPHNDNSLLIINSGMAPLKAYFAGAKVPPASTMTTCQKCIRTGDIENVGQTARHGTFFEMLGSFSFGDYFKKESLKWGLEFILNELKMPEEKIWVTVYDEDEEAVEIWKNLGISNSKIVKLGKKDNFWEIGLGPCGPCSEIYFDRGEEYGCDNPNCKPGCECDRYLEFWNHVFTQFSKEENGEYIPLENPNIDTGMGLERLACIMQGVDSIFDVDTIRAILNKVVAMSGVKYEDGKAKSDVSIRIITDHIRSVVFMIGDDIRPSNEGRGYVLRRLLRRAARHGKILGLEGAFLVELAEEVIQTSSGAYTELKEKQEYIKNVIKIEEEKFAQTIDQGTNIIQEYIDELKKSGKTVLEGDKIFKLYDTFGFPLELTEEILIEQNCAADLEGFKACMKNQREMARASRKSSDEAGWQEGSITLDLPKTEFIGYDSLSSTSIVLGVYSKGVEISQGDAGMNVTIILDKTPFYAEGGGQVSDNGIMSTNSFEGKVSNVVSHQGIYSHEVFIDQGSIKKGNEVCCNIDSIKRTDVARNHTATHLLQKALREVIGDHVLQAGSSVSENSLRFDFTNFKPLTKEELIQIESLVNKQINSLLPVTIKEMTIEEANALGAMALFGEKYGDSVRVVNIDNFSIELCGGTHIENTGYIGSFKIISESGIASGVRRIEAITGSKVLSLLNSYDTTIEEISSHLKTNKNKVESRVLQLIDDLKKANKELEELKKANMGNELDEIVASAEKVGDVLLIAKKLEGYSVNDLRSLSDEIKSKYKNIIMVFANIEGDKVTFLVSITNDLLEKNYHAGKLIKEIAAACGGGGGGKADMAQAGAKDITKIDNAFQVARDLIK